MNAFSLTHQRLFFQMGFAKLSLSRNKLSFLFRILATVCTARFLISQLPLVATVCHLSYKQLLLQLVFCLLFMEQLCTQSMSECIGLTAVHSSFILEHPARLKSSQLQCTSELLSLILCVSGSAHQLAWNSWLSSSLSESMCQTSAGDAWCSGSFSPSCCHRAVLASLALMIWFQVGYLSATFLLASFCPYFPVTEIYAVYLEIYIPVEAPSSLCISPGEQCSNLFLSIYHQMPKKVNAKPPCLCLFPHLFFIFYFIYSCRP